MVLPLSVFLAPLPSLFGVHCGQGQALWRGDKLKMSKTGLDFKGKIPDLAESRASEQIITERWEGTAEKVGAERTRSGAEELGSQREVVQDQGQRVFHGEVALRWALKGNPLLD